MSCREKFLDLHLSSFHLLSLSGEDCPRTLPTLLFTSLILRYFLFQTLLLGAFCFTLLFISSLFLNLPFQSFHRLNASSIQQYASIPYLLPSLPLLLVYHYNYCDLLLLLLQNKLIYLAIILNYSR